MDCFFIIRALETQSRQREASVCLVFFVVGGLVLALQSKTSAQNGRHTD